MQLKNGRLSASPTDLANFVACRHKTALDLQVARGELARPTWKDPLADVLRDRGNQHERRYIDTLRAEGLEIVDLSGVERDVRAAAAVEAMRAGADVVVQAALQSDRWAGYADVLRKVPTPSPAFGGWSYEAHDTKLSRETRAGAILQLSVYSELLGDVQQTPPDQFVVVTPLRSQAYRVAQFGAFYRSVKDRFVQFLNGASGGQTGDYSTYPEPTDHCPVCRWYSRCNAQRRADDHLSFVCGLGRHHAEELSTRAVRTVAALASIPLPLAFVPARGAKETYERLREQARLQVEQRASGTPRFERLEVQPDLGLHLLPEPRPGDLFLDLEGDPFARQTLTGASGEGSREYLFGLGRVHADGTFAYTARWAFTDGEERAAFEAVMTDIISALDEDPNIHVFHYASYEPVAFKRLMGRYAAREQELDRLLRGRRFVDLYAVVRHAIRAGIESYSIKNLERFCGFTRKVDLDDAGTERRIVEVALEMNDPEAIAPNVRAIVEGYNRDDCESLVYLRRWLESLRPDDLARPPLEPGEAKEDIKERQQRINALRTRLLLDVPQDMSQHTPEQHARYLLAYLLDWHFREDKAVWWEYFRLLELSDEDLLDEPNAVAGLQFIGTVDVVRHKKTGNPTGSVIDRYRYPPQECEIRAGTKLNLRDGTVFGEVVASDRATRTLDVKKGRRVVDTHPPSAFVHERVSPDAPAAALFRLGQIVADAGVGALSGGVRDLLLRQTGRGLLPAPEEEPAADYATRIATRLGATALPIQGPPGAGKTYTGARMICALVAAGRRVGITATGHKVIRLLLDAVIAEAEKHGLHVRVGHKPGQLSEHASEVVEFKENGDALAAIRHGDVDVLGGTAWLWSRPEFADAVDVLFVDEAGQMSLANALAASHAAPSLVLLGDPQQLEQPEKGSHPDGVGVSVLEHVLEQHQTMPPDRGLFLPVTWRLPPSIAAFTSEVFYEGKLTSKTALERQRLVGCDRFDGAGLFYVEAHHDGCRSASDQEAELVATIVLALVAPGSRWVDERGVERQLTPSDILVVAPYNAHVARLQERLAAAVTALGQASAVPRIGTVDRFQGQEAPVVIYSMATSRPEDAPRGLEFLYSPNRLNVATSRARCACILVANPRLFEPECRTPRQMTLANALCRFLEMTDSRMKMCRVE